MSPPPRLENQEKETLTGTSWHRDCPMSLRFPIRRGELRLGCIRRVDKLNNNNNNNNSHNNNNNNNAIRINYSE